MDLACDIRIGSDNASWAQSAPREATLLWPGEGVTLEAAPLSEVDDKGPQVRRGDVSSRGGRFCHHDTLNSVPMKKT